MAFKKNLTRVGGSGFTIFTFKGAPIAFAQQVSHTSPQPVGPGAVPIQPMDEPYPLQVITPAAAGMGSLTLNLYELYYSKVWERLGVTDNQVTNNSSGTGGFFDGANDIVDVFIRQAAADPASLNVVKIIRPPALAGEGDISTGGDPYWEIYHNCVITNVVDGEEISIGTMEVLKQITLGYTNVTRKGTGTPLAYQLRDRAISAVDTTLTT